MKNLFGLEFIYMQVWVLNIARKASHFIKTEQQITLQLPIPLEYSSIKFNWAIERD